MEGTEEVCVDFEDTGKRGGVYADIRYLLQGGGTGSSPI